MREPRRIKMYALAIPRRSINGNHCKQGQLLFPLSSIQPGRRWTQDLSPRNCTRDLKVFDLARARLVAVQSRGRRRQVDAAEYGHLLERFGAQLRLAHEATQSPHIAKVLAAKA